MKILCLISLCLLCNLNAAVADGNSSRVTTSFGLLGGESQWTGPVRGTFGDRLDQSLSTGGLIAGVGSQIPFSSRLFARYGVEGQFEWVLNRERGRNAAMTIYGGLSYSGWLIDLGFQPIISAYWQADRSEVLTDPGLGAQIRIARELNYLSDSNQVWLTLSYFQRFYEQLQEGSLPETKAQITESGVRIGVLLQLSDFHSSTKGRTQP